MLRWSRTVVGNVRIASTVVVTAIVFLAGSAMAGETLYNGIELPDQWPPRRDELKREPMPLPYLEDLPKLIPIDVGRQLLVDDFLIERSDLKRMFHRPTLHETNPVLKADQPWETSGESYFVAPFQGRVLYDPRDRLFKMWYLHSTKGDYYCDSYGYAISEDGIHWKKPVFAESGRPDAETFSPKKGTNLVIQGRRTCCNSVVLDYYAKSPDERFMMFSSDWIDRKWNCVYRTSADGIHWSAPLARRPVWGDYVLAFYNPFRRVWVYEGRIHGGDVGRCRAYLENPDLRTLAQSVPYNQRMNLEGDSVYWVGADDLDPRHPDPRFKDIKPQLYSLSVAPYESLTLGLFAIWTGPDNSTVAREGLQKHNQILTGFSRDGFHWDRPDRTPIISPTWKKGKWNYGNVQPVGGCCLVVGEKLYIYFSTRIEDKTGMHGNATTGLATLRRDGFASLDAGDRPGSMTTRPITFQGRHLFVNVDCPEGELKAEVLDGGGNVIEPFTLANCTALSCNQTTAAVRWQGVDDLSGLSGRPVHFRFHLRNGSLYAFWVGPDVSGASHGYVAAGGPGFTGPTDTVGLAARKAARDEQGKGGSHAWPRPRRIGHATQLLIDDALIHRREGVVSRVQPAAKMDRPVLTPERPWEFSYLGESGDPGIRKRIYVYGTVFYDPLRKRYRMWYMSRMSRGHNHEIPELEIPGGGNRWNDLTLYADSEGGIRWQRPNLGVVRFNGSGENNIVGGFHGASVLLDPREPDPQKRYTAIGFIRRHQAIGICCSPDGVHWSRPGPAGDRTNEGSFNACYVPSLGLYAAGSIERSSDARYEFTNWQGRRAPKRVIATLWTEGKDLTRWQQKTFIYPDDRDDPNTQFYGMTPFVYGDLVLGFLHVFHYRGAGPANDDGPMDVQLIYSRDGRTWHRLEDRRPVIPVGAKGSFDGGMIMGTACGAFADGDELVAYYTASNTTHGAPVKDKFFTIGRATWPRDRLVALQAGAEGGTVETVLLEVPGGRLQVNADAEGGHLTVEVLDAKGNVQPGLSASQCVPIESDLLRHEVQWKDADLASAKRPFRLRFRLSNARLFAFRFQNNISSATAEFPKTAAGHPPEADIDAFLGKPKFELRKLFTGGTPARRGGGRLPNVVLATDGTVLATLGATGGNGDWWDKGLQVRRSEDGGKTRGEPITIANPGWQGGGLTVDEANGDVLAFVEGTYVGNDPNGTRLTIYRSTDHGKTWRAQAGTVVHKDSQGNVPSMSMAEHGITLRRGPHMGRLLRPARDYAGGDRASEWHRMYTNAIYSDDGGKTWKTSDPFPTMRTGEGTVAELSDGRIYYNTRRHWDPPGSTYDPNRRWEAFSDGGGATWKDAAICEGLPDGPLGKGTNGCHAGLVRLPVCGRDIVVYSNCDSTTGQRRNVTVWASFEGTRTWPIKRSVYSGPSAYSSLAAGRPGTPSEGWIYILLEGGENYRHEGAYLARFSLAWLFGGKKTGDGELPPWLDIAVKMSLRSPDIGGLASNEKQKLAPI